MINLVRTSNSNVLSSKTIVQAVCARMLSSAAVFGRQRTIFSNRVIHGIALIISAALLLNSLSVKSIIHQIDGEDVAQIIASQSVLADYFYHSTLPIKLLNKYLAEYLAPAITIRKAETAPLDKKKAKTENTSSAVALFQPATSFQRVSESQSTRTPVDGSSVRLLWQAFNVMSDTGRSTGTGLMTCLLICLCCYYFARARSSIDADAASTAYSLTGYPVCQNIHRVFFYEKFTFTTTGRPL